jgi:hypothetical protein
VNKEKNGNFTNTKVQKKKKKNFMFLVIIELRMSEYFLDCKLDKNQDFMKKTIMIG